MTETFGQCIKRIRKEVHLNQDYVAANIGVCKTYLSKIENDKMPPPSEDFCIKFAKLLYLNPFVIILLAGKIPSAYLSVLQKNPEICNLIEDKIEEKRDD